MQKEKILIIGGGGREHALGWKIAQSPRAVQMYFAPGNAGTASIGINVALKATDVTGLLEFAKNEKIDLTLAIPDDPLALGIVNIFRKEGLRIWGPTKEASELEWSKAFAKNFMKTHNLPTAKFGVFVDYDSAKKYIKDNNLPIVIKASGLALGKGVLICNTYNEALEAMDDIFVKKVFGEAGNEVVIEEFLVGPEVSTHAFSDGEHFSFFPVSQDHKRIGDGDTGLNTGGMGTIAPVSFVREEMIKEIKEKIVSTTISGMARGGKEFQGILYPGLMLTADGPKILEYNARFGDPETQTYMRLLDTDLLDIIDATLEKKLDKLEIKWKSSFACNIVLASSGYPGEYPKGKVITGIDGAEMEKGVIVFHAGTKLNEKGELITNGGRVLGVSAIAETLPEALKKAYKAIEKIKFEGMQYRKDIGQGSLKLIK